MDKKLSIFIVIVIVSFVVDQVLQKSSNLVLLSYAISFVHHIISIYGAIGGIMFGYHKLHLFFLFIVLCGWTYFGRCPLTIWYNNVSNITPHPSHSSHQDLPTRLYRSITTRDAGELIYAVMLYDVYRIYTHSES